MKMPPIRIIAFISLLGFCATPASTQTPPPSAQVENLQKCALIQSDSERLACFDSAVSKLNTAVTTGEIMIVDTEAVQTVKKDVFGLNIPSLSGLGGIFKSSEESGIAKDVDEVELTLEKMEGFGYKRFRFFFTNGQIWDQAEPATVKSARTRDGVKPTALIEKAALGSFTLRVNGKGKKIKVRRVK